LNSFCTNDIKKLTPGQACEAFFCQLNGKIVGHGFVECQAERLVIDTAAGQAAPLIKHLDRYVIREDVRLADRSGETRGWLFSAAAGEGLRRGLLGAETDDARRGTWRSEIAGVEVTLRSCPWEDNGRSLLVECPADATPAPLESLRAIAREQGKRDGQGADDAERMVTLLDDEAFDLWRVMRGFPIYGRDISLDNLPQEVGRDARAISFHKGCYLGQEPVARIDAMGKVNWELISFAAPGAEWGGEWIVGGILAAQNKPALRLTTVLFLPALRGVVGLAYVRRELRRLARPQISCPVAEGVLVTSAGDVLINPVVFST
jgi:folate-binding protein YgfZ